MRADISEKPKNYEEDDLLPISALQHFSFCPRQCALIHIEAQWSDNRYTVEGNHLHEKTHQITQKNSSEIRVVTGLKIHSFDLGLYGIADVVEFHRVKSAGTTIAGVDGEWRPSPVEYKRGTPKQGECDRVQLCAQAICLEEMLRTPISEGEIFYGQIRRREHVEFSEELRVRVQEDAAQLHDLFEKGETPNGRYEKKCDSCSMKGICLPKLFDRPHPVADYLSKLLT